MGDQHPPTITSFVIRFVLEDTPPDGDGHALLLTPYRGAIRHVQSDETLHFSAWGEAVQFIRRYVPLEAGKQE